jgi:hypothetical protein
MTRTSGVGGLVLCAAALGPGLAAPAATGDGLESGLCDRCLQVCTPPLNHEDAVLLGLSSAQPMRAAERRAVCQVLAQALNPAPGGPAPILGFVRSP